ncbi:MAG: hypothetical protein LUF85_06590, partial [Bacteroides sp.]|nr:hypothetical protein [Bacteroides sp.]
MLYKGSDSITDIYVGDAKISKIYTGDRIAWRRKPKESKIIQTHVTNGTFHHAALSSDGILYFCSMDDTGIWKLEPNGNIQQTNVTSGTFYHAAL